MKKVFSILSNAAEVGRKMFITLLGGATIPRLWEVASVSKPSDNSQGWDRRHNQCIDSFVERLGAETVCTFFTSQSTPRARLLFM